MTRARASRPATRRITPDTLQPAYDLVARQVAAGELPAVVLAVADRHGPIRVGALGQGRERVTPRSRFMIASISKPIFATCVLQLAEAGLLDLDRPVQADLPEFRPPPAARGEPGGESITPRMILCHTAGLDEDWERIRRERPTAQRIYAALCTTPLCFAPGSRFRYTSNSWFVLGQLAERLTGTPYRELLRERLLEPLGMAETDFALPRQDRAPVHGFGPHPWQIPVYVRLFTRLAHPAGGLWSSVDDLLRFGRAMLRGGELDGRRVIAESWLAEMTRLQTNGLIDDEEPGRDPHYALGWGRSGLDPGRPGSAAVFDHGGSSAGRLWVDPDLGLVIAYLANRWGSSSRHALAAIGAVYEVLGVARPSGDPPATEPGGGR